MDKLMKRVEVPLPISLCAEVLRHNRFRFDRDADGRGWRLMYALCRNFESTRACGRSQHKIYVPVAAPYGDLPLHIKNKPAVCRVFFDLWTRREQVLEHELANDLPMDIRSWVVALFAQVPDKEDWRRHQSWRRKDLDSRDGDDRVTGGVFS